MKLREAEALARIRGYAGANRIEYSSHARQRMRERGASREDVRSALVTARDCSSQPDERWTVVGEDTLGDELTVVVVIEDGVVVVTLF